MITELKAFSLLIVIMRSSMKKWELSLTDSPRNLSETYVVWSWLIRVGKTFLRHSAKIFDSNFVSRFINEIGLQLIMSLLPLDFFSNSLITACLWEADKNPLFLPSKRLQIKVAKFVSRRIYKILLLFRRFQGFYQIESFL